MKEAVGKSVRTDKGAKEVRQAIDGATDVVAQVQDEGV